MAEFDFVNPNALKPGQPFVVLPEPDNQDSAPAWIADIRLALSQANMVIIPNFYPANPTAEFSVDAVKKKIGSAIKMVQCQGKPSQDLSHISRSPHASISDAAHRLKDRSNPYLIISYKEFFNNAGNPNVCQSILDSTTCNGIPPPCIP
jgi:hypothetical protein